MVLLQINATYDYGSTGRIVKDIDRIAAKKGYQSFVACAVGPQMENVYHIGNKLDHKIHAFLCRINGRQAYFSRRATKNLIKYIKEIKPDIVHLHNLHSNYVHLNLLLDYLVINNIPTVITMHDCWYYTGKCFHYTAEGCSKWKNGCFDCSKRKTDTPTWFTDKSHKTYEDKKARYQKIKKLYVVGVSKWIASEAEKSILNTSRISYCYNGVDVNVFFPKENNLREEYNIDKDCFVILGMANKWKLKQNTAYTEVIKQLLDDEVKIVLIGCSGNTSFDERIVQIPIVNCAEEMADWYSLADVFVNLTYEDTLPFVNLEAQACGTPVITHRTSGATETITKDTGIAIDPGSPIELLQAICKIREKGKKQFLDACVDRIKTVFNKENVYDEYFRIYEEIENGKE